MLKKTVMVVLVAVFISASVIAPVSYALNGYGTTRLALLNSQNRVPSDNTTSVMGFNSTGRYIFFHSADNTLVDNDLSTNGLADAFRYDTLSGAVEMINRDENSAQTTSTGGALAAPSGSRISSNDGRYVTFTANGSCYLRDMNLDVTDVIYRSQGVGSKCETAGVSGDGEWVAYSSVSLPYGQPKQVYLYNISSKTATLVSSSLAGESGNAGSELVNISDSGQYISYTTAATNIDTMNNGSDPYYTSYVRYNRPASTNTVLQEIKDQNCALRSSSVNGAYYLLFCSRTNASGEQISHLARYETSTGSLIVIDHPSLNSSPSHTGPNPSEISPDGNLIGLQFYANQPVDSMDTNSHSDGVLYNIATGALMMTGTASSGTLANNDNSSPYGIIDDNSKYLFNSTATNLSSTSTGFTTNVYEHFVADNAPSPSFDLTPPSTSKLSVSPNPKIATQTSTVSMKATDTKGVQIVEYYIGTDPGQGYGTVMTLGANSVYSATLPNSLSIGSYTLKARAMDTSGNWSAPLSIALVVQ